jgi:hypothetical protein
MTAAGNTADQGTRPPESAAVGELDHRLPRLSLGRVPEVGPGRDNGAVAEVTDTVDLSAWPKHCRLIVRRERPHPGAQLSFADHDGYRFQATLTDQDDPDLATLECRHRQHAHVEDRIRDDKDIGLSKFPYKEFALNEVWLQIVALAHDLIVWTQALVLDCELARAEPKRLRCRSRAVGKDDKLSQRVEIRGLDRVWGKSIDSVNSLIEDLTRPTSEMQRVIGAVADGDLSKKITADVHGEVLELKNTINGMVDQLQAVHL